MTTEKKIRRFAYRVNGKLVTFSRVSKHRVVVVISEPVLNAEEAKGDVEAFLARLVRWAEAER